MMRDSAFFFLSSIALIVQRSAGNLLVARSGRLNEVPLVFAAIMLVRVLGWSLADSVSRVMQPYIIMMWGRQQRDRVRFLAALSTKITFAVAVVFGAGVWLFGRDAMEWWLGRGRFLDSQVLGVLAAAFVADMLFLSGTNFLWVIGRHRRLSVAIGSYAVLSVAFGALGMHLSPGAPVLGMATGFAAASLAGQVLPMPFVITRGFEIRPREYAWNWLLQPLIPCACALALLAFGWLAGVQGTGQRLLLGLAVVLTVALAGWTIMLGGAERDWLRRIVSHAGGAAEGMTPSTVRADA